MSIFKSGPDIPDDNPPIPEEEDRIMEKFAKWIVRKRLSVPAIMFIESGRPLNYIASQFMVFSEPLANPMLQTFFNIRDYEIFQQAMERRENIENILLKIEKYDAEMAEYEKSLKKFEKEQKKNWKWHHRWLGIGAPRINYPEELRAPRFVIEEEKLAAEEKKKNQNR